MNTGGGIYLFGYVSSVTTVVASPALLVVVLSTAAQHRQQWVRAGSFFFLGSISIALAGPCRELQQKTGSAQSNLIL